MLFLPLPHFHQHTSRSFFFFFTPLHPITFSALRVPTLPVICVGKQVPRAVHDAAWTASLGVGIPEQLCREQLLHVAGCRILSNNPEKERCDVNRRSTCKGGKWSSSHVVAAVPEFQRHGWIPVPFSHSYVFYVIFYYFLRVQIIRNNR